ncbi:hypothetical protein [Kineococcus sp. SYSU DK003]|uniref:hypothetical protein n=1 Tax=Kineococcus sp. SYSU DK003 TaxID=3383124 RepID=UPI003D7CE9BD
MSKGERRGAVSVGKTPAAAEHNERGPKVIDLRSSDRDGLVLKSGDQRVEVVTVDTEPKKRRGLRQVLSPRLRRELVATRDELRAELADPKRKYAPPGKRKRVRI